MPAPASGSLDIGALAREAGVSSRTVRYYGELGLLPARGRDRRGRRLYGPDALERLRFIQRLKRLGLTLEEIGELSRAFEEGQTPRMLARLEELLLGHMESVHTRIEELRRLHADLGSYLERVRARRTAASPHDPS